MQGPSGFAFTTYYDEPKNVLINQVRVAAAPAGRPCPAMMRHGMTSAAPPGNMSLQVAAGRGSISGITGRRHSAPNGGSESVSGSAQREAPAITLGVEEELFLVDPVHPRPTGRTRPGHPRGLREQARPSQGGARIPSRPARNQHTRLRLG